MKVRVIEKEGAFYSEYFDETARVPRWEGTFRNNNCVIQNRFKDKEAAIEECKTFAENKSEGKTVYEADL